MFVIFTEYVEILSLFRVGWTFYPRLLFRFSSININADNLNVYFKKMYDKKLSPLFKSHIHTYITPLYLTTSEKCRNLIYEGGLLKKPTLKTV